MKGCGFSDVVKEGAQWRCSCCRRVFNAQWFAEVMASLPRKVWRHLV